MFLSCPTTPGPRLPPEPSRVGEEMAQRHGYSKGQLFRGEKPASEAGSLMGEGRGPGRGWTGRDLERLRPEAAFSTRKVGGGGGGEQLPS